VHTRIPVSREDIGYGYREFGFFDERGRLHTYKKGALFCGPSGFSDAEHQSVVDCGDFSTTLEDGYLGCEMDVSDHVAGDLDLFAQTHLASIRIGDVFFPALPGRAGSLLAADLRLRLSVAEGASMESIYVLGGSQDHQFVLLKQEDWLQGGAETADSMWGYYFGDYIEDASIDMTRALFTREHEEIAPAAGPPLTPATNSSMSSGAEALDAGTAAADPAPVIRRQGFASFSWYGGEPETDLPVALVQRLDGDDDWEPVQRSNGFGLTSDGMEMILEHQAVPGYREDPDATARRYRWTVLWEILADQPTGTYRFAVSGKQGDPGAPRAYSLDSRPFTIERSPDLSVAMLSAEQIGEDRVRFTVEALYPPTDGGFRLRDDRVPSSQHIPVRTGNAIVTVTAGTGSDIMEVQCGYDADVQAFRGIFFKTHPQGTVYRAEVKGGDVTDGYGNTSSGASGSLEFQ